MQAELLGIARGRAGAKKAGQGPRPRAVTRSPAPDWLGGARFGHGSMLAAAAGGVSAAAGEGATRSS
jgi:hypothetical protein